MKIFSGLSAIFNKVILSILACVFLIIFAFTQETEEEYQTIDNGSCIECHETGKHETKIQEDISHSVHDSLDCLECHTDKDTMPHKDIPDFVTGRQECAVCHEDAAEEYTTHGRVALIEDEEIPTCSDCHGDHDILPSSAKLS